MFDRIAADDVPLREVEAFVRRGLAQPGTDFARRLYTSLRAWTWKALNSRRRDADLRDWYGLMRRVAGFLRKGNAPYADRLTALYELVFESIAVADKLRPEDVASRDHVREVLEILVRSPGTEVERARLVDRTGLKQANLSRVLNMVEASGLIERERVGNRSRVRLTVEGAAACERLGIGHKPKGVPVRRVVPARKPMRFAGGPGPDRFEHAAPFDPENLVVAGGMTVMVRTSFQHDPAHPVMHAQRIELGAGARSPDVVGGFRIGTPVSAARPRDLPSEDMLRKSLVAASSMKEFGHE